ILMIPVKNYYLIGAPLFEQSEVVFQGKKLFIKTENFATDKYRVKKALFNGQEIKDFRIVHKDLIQGGELKIEFE
ncbi:MAG: glycoside hydrolase family 92 protein, partial [Deltaproteobacteria bacterium]|nr:glycoside hydrolase family 92 protein [Deltaproteobacteria bacterium]